MDKEYIQPPELFESNSFGYTQVVTTPPGKQVFIAGQGAFDKNFNLVGEDDLAAQTECALGNILHGLHAAGATPDDVTSIRIYVVDYKPEHAMVVGPKFSDFFSGSPPPVSTLIGVQALGLAGMLIELEVTAVVL